MEYSFFKNYLFIDFSVYVYMVECMYVHHGMCTMCMQGPVEVRRAFRSLGSEITYGCELARRCWELNLGPLLDQ